MESKKRSRNTAIAKRKWVTAKANVTGVGQEPTNTAISRTKEMIANVSATVCGQELTDTASLRTKAVTATASATGGGEKPRAKPQAKSRGQGRMCARNLPVHPQTKAKNTAISRRKWVTTKTSTTRNGQESTDTAISRTKGVD